MARNLLFNLDELLSEQRYTGATAPGVEKRRTGKSHLKSEIQKGEMR